MSNTHTSETVTICMKVMTVLKAFLYTLHDFGGKLYEFMCV